jgi:hypothetical protein
MPSHATQALVAERRAKVLQMRVASVPVSVIAQQFGVSESTIHMDVNRALETRSKLLDEATQEYRSLECEKLEALERTAWTVLHRKHYHVAASGKVGRHPDTGELLIDDGPTLQAISSLLRIQERRAKLLGLDAIVKASVEVKQVDSGVDAEIARLLSGLATGGQGPAVGGPEVLPVAPAGTP